MILAGMIKAAGGEYVLKASTADIFATVDVKNEDGTLRRCSRCDYVKAEIESGQTHDKIVITEIPYNVNKAELIKYIADLVNDKKIEGISNANDESDRDGMRIVIDTEKGRIVLP